MGFCCISLDAALYMEKGDKGHTINYFCRNKEEQMVIHPKKSCCVLCAYRYMRDQKPVIGIQADNITAVSLVNLEKF